MLGPIGAGSRRGVVAVGLAASCWLTPRLALAQGPAPDQSVTAQCVSDFDRAQTLRDQGQLLAAQKALASCARAECPAVVTSKCVPWLEEVTTAIPSIVVAAKDGKGNDVVNVRVRLGDTILAESLDGRPIELDPGTHTLRFEREGTEPIELRIVARQGEKLRAVEVRFAEPPVAPSAIPAPKPAHPTKPRPAASSAKPQESSAGGTSPLVYIGFGIGGAGLLVGSIAGVMAFGQKSSLEDQCQTSCTQDDIDKGKRVATVSTVGFAVAGVGAALGVVGLMGSSAGGGGERAARRARSSLYVGIAPGALGLWGRF